MPFTWSAVLWALVAPTRGQRIVPTISGTLLIGLALGIGSAAYNSANNILFITLALLLACLILSGVLAWLNLRGVTWRLRVERQGRVGDAVGVGVELRNEKMFLPTYGLWFELSAQPVATGAPAKVATTLHARREEWRAALKKADEGKVSGQVELAGRLDAAGEARLEWAWRPERRGRARVELAGVGSLFPFGFLRKSVTTDESQEVVVWPARVAYRRFGGGAERRGVEGAPTAQVGGGGELHGLRRYGAGDSHRRVHWKASARAGRLLVREFAAERAEGVALWVRTDAGAWARPEQFELAVSLAATLAEDWFREGRLMKVAINAERPRVVRSGRDVEEFLDRLAVVEMTSEAMGAEGAEPGLERLMARQVMTLVPEGERGVAAYLNGEKTASA